MPRLFSAVLARNEAAGDRYWLPVLKRLTSFSDAVLVLDDGSTDHTRKIARSFGCTVRKRAATVPAWGGEAPARAELWDLALEHATEPNDWVLFCDADMLWAGNPRDLIWSLEVNAWAAILYDVWDPQQTVYRADSYWVGHLHPRVWMVAPRRVPGDWQASWTTRGIHCGHIPENFPFLAGIAPPERYYYLHLAYAKPEHRAAKAEQYLAQRVKLTPTEIAHAESILDS